MSIEGATTVHRIAGGPWDQNCYVVSAGSRDAVVVDPGGGANLVADRVEASGLRLHAVLATHGHHDHVSAVAELIATYDVPFGMHSGDSSALRRLNFARLAFHEAPPVAIPTVSVDLAETDRLRFGDLEITAVHTPGHSPGSVCLEIGGELFTGDTLLATQAGRTDLPGGSRRALDASIAALSERYPPETRLRPGHGEPGALGDAVAAPRRELCS